MEADRISRAEAALAAATRQKLTPAQRLMVRDCPELLRRLAHASAQEPRRFEVAEDIADDAVPRVARRLEQIAGFPRAKAVTAFFEQSKAVLHPLCLEVALAMQGKPTDLNGVVENVLCMLSELPGDKRGVIWRFGPRKFVSDKGDPADKILGLLTTPAKRRRQSAERHIEPASRTEIEGLAERWDEHRSVAAASWVAHFDVPWPRKLGDGA